MKVSDVKIEKLGKEKKSTSKSSFSILFCYIVLLLSFYWIYHALGLSTMQESLLCPFSATVGCMFCYTMYDIFLEDLIKDLKTKYSFDANKIAYSYKSLPINEYFRFNEFVDRIAVSLITHGIMKKRQFKKLHNLLLHTFIKFAFGGVIFELFKSKKLIKDQWFVLTSERFYWGITNEMLELGIIPVKALIGKIEAQHLTVCESDWGEYDYVIVLESEEDLNLFRLNIRNDHDRYVAVSTNDVIKTIDDVLKDKVDVWKMENYGGLELCLSSNILVTQLSSRKYSYSNHPFAGMVNIPIQVHNSNLPTVGSASCGQKTNATPYKGSKKGP